MTDFSNFKFRAHYIGYLMTNPRGKSNKEKFDEAMASYSKKQDEYANMNKGTKTADKLLLTLDKLKEKTDELQKIKDLPNLSTTCKSKLAEIFTTETTGRKKELKAKYIEKGLLLEEDAITNYSLLQGVFYKKNKLRLSNDFCEGETDFRDEDTVFDTKVSWDIFTYDANAFKVINPIYDWQGEAYMWLFCKRKFRLIYTLLNTPKHLVEAEKKRLVYEMFGDTTNYDFAPESLKTEYKKACEEIEHLHNYDDLPLERKVQYFDTVQSEERIEQMKVRLPQCRDYLNNFTTIKTKDDETED